MNLAIIYLYMRRGHGDHFLRGWKFENGETQVYSVYSIHYFRLTYLISFINIRHDRNVVQVLMREFF